MRVLLNDGGAEGSDAIRRCIVTGENLPKAMLLRFVVAPNKTLTPDIVGKLPGKGVWVRCNQRMVKQAAEKKLFNKAVKAVVVIPSLLEEQVAILLKTHCLNMLSMAKKSGMLVSGYAKLQALQAERKAVLILRAYDSAYAAQEKKQESGGVPVVTLFSNDELSSTLGCENVVHVALRQSAIATQCKSLIDRYSAYIHHNMS